MSDWEALNPAIASSSALTSAGWPWWAQTVISPVPSPGFGVSPPASGLPPPHAETARTDAATSAMLQRPRDVCMATSNLCSPLLANRFANSGEHRLEVAMHTSRGRWSIALVAASVLAVSACGGGSPEAGGDTPKPGDGTGEITVWAHQGQPAEVKALEEAIAGFNASQSDIQATLQFVPEADYTKTVTTTDPSSLPDVLEYDGPMMASLVYAGKLAPIDDLISAETLKNQTDSVLAQNAYPGDGKLYGISQFDSSLGIYGNKALLDAAGVTYPQGIDDAWTADEFEAALAA